MNPLLTLLIFPILAALLLGAIIATVIERLLSARAHHKELQLIRAELAAVNAKFDQLGNVQASLFTALEQAYNTSTRAYEMMRQEMKLVDDIINPEKAADQETPDAQTDDAEWPGVVGDKEPQ